MSEKNKAIAELNKIIRKELQPKPIKVVELEKLANEMKDVMKKEEKIEYHFYRGFLRAIEMLREKGLLKNE